MVYGGCSTVVRWVRYGGYAGYGTVYAGSGTGGTVGTVRWYGGYGTVGAYQRTILGGPGVVFFLWHGRSRSKARSLHEKKLLLRTSTWTQVVACSLAEPKHKPPKTQGKTQIPSQICVSPSKGQQSKQRTGQEPNRNNHKRFAWTQW